MKRRSFIKLAAAGAAGAVVGLPRLASAEWGEIPKPSSTPDFWPTGVMPAKKVLEIHLWGGLAPWESFYFRPDPSSQTRGFDLDVEALVWNPSCPGTPNGLASQFLANDSMTKPVHLGPFAMPLWRTDISSRTRVIVLSHDLAPHEAAIPYSLAGHRLGRPNFSGLGAAVQRRQRELAGSSHPLPFSYCLIPPLAATSGFFAALDATGGHPGSARPLVLTTGEGADAFLKNLDRSSFAPGNGLIDQYRAQYRQWLTAPGKTDPLRSTAFQEYASSVGSLFQAPQLSTLLAQSPLVAQEAELCARVASAAGFLSEVDYAAAAVKTAAYLLTRPEEEQARYVCIVDAGLGNLAPSYDVHGLFANPQGWTTSNNLWRVLSALANVLLDPNTPTSTDNEKLDLNDTVIVIKTEFGRTPYRSTDGKVDPDSHGRDHWPEGYVNVIIGGPIKAPGVVGSISDGKDNEIGVGRAEPGHTYKPEDVQCAVLLAAGIDPFADGNFQQGELTPSLQGANHHEARENLRDVLLGVVG